MADTLVLVNSSISSPGLLRLSHESTRLKRPVQSSKPDPIPTRLFPVWVKSLLSLPIAVCCKRPRCYSTVSLRIYISLIPASSSHCYQIISAGFFFALLCFPASESWLGWYPTRPSYPECLRIRDLARSLHLSKSQSQWTALAATYINHVSAL